MRKSNYVQSHIRQWRGRKLFLLRQPSEKDRIKYKHAFHLIDGIRPKRRIALWKANILLVGRRSYCDKDGL